MYQKTNIFDPLCAERKLNVHMTFRRRTSRTYMFVQFTPCVQEVVLLESFVYVLRRWLLLTKFIFKNLLSLACLWNNPRIRHVDSTLKWRGNDRFQVVSMRNPRGVFAGKVQVIIDNKLIFRLCKTNMQKNLFLFSIFTKGERWYCKNYGYNHFCIKFFLKSQVNILLHYALLTDHLKQITEIKQLVKYPLEILGNYVRNNTLTFVFLFLLRENVYP